MRKIVIIMAIWLMVCFIVASNASAKDLTNRISAGYNKQLNFGIIGGANSDLSNAFFGIDSFSCKYWFTEDMGMELMFGYFTAKYDEVGGWAADIAGKFLYNVIKEDNMNVYTGAGLGIIPVHIDYGEEDETETGFHIMGFGGVEFFLNGLPNLAFDIEIGLEYIDIDEYAQLNTYGGAFGAFGIRYYF
jgi:hypothetical protein